ncbi:Hypothetical_protein [Hexamita inflata]|uniref:Hypothetical_protein n=1 Tax=Hexamita inflata TaxID=28002 RepID=A0AA86PDM5_9EUKA|nr:Hypothetical protein HINF_LOCUS24696 [Hexamita inflata]
MEWKLCKQSQSQKYASSQAYLAHPSQAVYKNNGNAGTSFSNTKTNPNIYLIPASSPFLLIIVSVLDPSAFQQHCQLIQAASIYIVASYITPSFRPLFFFHYIT